MKQPAYGLDGKRLALAAICIVCAVALIGAALLAPEKSSEPDWVPLNQAVDSALGRLEGGDREPEPSAAGAGSATEPSEAREGAAEPAGSAPALSTDAEAPDHANGTGEAVVPPANAETAGADVPAASLEPAGDGRLDINRATAEELDALKGIGPSKAQAIVADREQNGFFKSERDLLRVKGIGEKLLSGIRDAIVARP
ncbi:helix-hairpin-helix domain-containing protein [Paenibacillus arenilitoris]|uniref:Helix-hairpin-helix domain-containing protein n=1 Tax=Paenibacillus arenilitoris TaxID=2772299 RepID=A0A927HAU3_9BACL|nr:helix-hairpin-helix domain-containing protein [Paenibacillus arenilitoris]MBD2872959.1 helix-hairpin-helix domain-containing protein [Paenibacillus arenilitoris]